MQYWWVNHKQTVRQEIDGQYLWSPKTRSDGTRNEFYLNMRRANPGDLVLSYADGAVRWVGRVTEFAFAAPKPEEFGRAGQNWGKDGWLLPVFWTPLSQPVQPKPMIDLLRPLLPTTHSPLNANTGNGNQNSYLAAISRELFAAITAGTAFDHDMLAVGGANSLTYDVVKELLDDVEERNVLGDESLSATVKESVVQARRGQGQFRKNVFRWEKVCRLTGISNPELLIASHIKPWRVCESAAERLDGRNGLLLTPDADRLFDRGFITFLDDGRTQVSPRADPFDLERLGFPELAAAVGKLSDHMAHWHGNELPDSQRAYMNFHRRDVYLE